LQNPLSREGRRSTGTLGYVQILSGAVEEGVLTLQEAVQAQSRMGFRYGLSMNFARLSEGLRVAGRLDETTKEAQRGMALAVECGERRFEASFHRILGEIAALQIPTSGKLANTRWGLEIATELGARPVVAHCHLGLGKLYRRTDKREQAQEHLTTAAAMYREIDMRFWLEQAEAELRRP
jgi:hypothetical protein